MILLQALNYGIVIGCRASDAVSPYVDAAILWDYALSTT